MVRRGLGGDDDELGRQAPLELRQLDLHDSGSVALERGHRRVERDADRCLERRERLPAQHTDAQTRHLVLLTQERDRQRRLVERGRVA